MSLHFHLKDPNRYSATMCGEPMARPRFKNIFLVHTVLFFLIRSEERFLVGFVDFGHYTGLYASSFIKMLRYRTNAL